VPAKLRILVVEDNRDSADSLKMLLELLGNEVEVAYDGEAALAAASARPPDLAFLDIGLPGMSGHQLARRLRERQLPGARLRIVALTGWGFDADRERSARAGFDHHIVKPPDLEVLKQMLELARRGAA
jgi:two-component system CheB/CheR fusion protein